MKRKSALQMSESVELGVILALAGGFMDAYSYICRGRVFANAQTGNMLLLGINLAEGNFRAALEYLLPVLAFTAGIAAAYAVRRKLYGNSLIHWRQVSVLAEIAALAVVCLMPQGMNLLANSLTSLACGVQVESFRKIHGDGVATTMCIGNLRSGTHEMCEYASSGDKGALKHGLLYYGIIACFVVGAIIGNFCIGALAEKAILVCAAILALAFAMMFVDREKNALT
jgi:uncharacterized membrane protein YoaK (UPF0700 family)